MKVASSVLVVIFKHACDRMSLYIIGYEKSHFALGFFFQGDEKNAETGKEVGIGGNKLCFFFLILQPVFSRK